MPSDSQQSDSSVDLPQDLPQLPNREPNAHKGDFGRAALVGGSRGMSGAIALAGISALRSGAGLVRLGVPRGCQPIVASLEPSYMTVALEEDSEGCLAAAALEQLQPSMKWATALACGPGLGRSADLNELVRAVYREPEQPAVFDADALNALAESRDALVDHNGPRVLTPHPGEFARLTGVSADDIAADRPAHCRELAARTRTVVVLKGHRTVISDGTQSIENTAGNPGMATGGTGDVLTGVIAGFLCQGLSAFDAARLGVFVHGLAGDLAAAELGQVAMIASDLPRFLPAALQRVMSESQRRQPSATGQRGSPRA